MGTGSVARTLFLGIACAALSACGGGDGGSSSSSGSGDGGGSSSSGGGGDSGPDAGSNSDSALGRRLVTPTPELQGSFRFFGYVDLVDDTFAERVNYDANFLRMREVQPASVFANSVPIAVDTCALRVTTAIPTDVGTIGFPDAEFELVGAGDTFTLSADAGTYAEIDRSAERFDIAPYPMPDDLTLDIPGAEFPGFADVAVPNVVVVQDFSPVRSQTLSAATEVTWTPSGVAGNSVYLRTFDFPSSDRVVDLRCRMADDGSFTLPEAIVAHLDETLSPGWELEGVEQERGASRLVVQGDALLVVGRRRD